jgi:hypothetical protein
MRKIAATGSLRDAAMNGDSSAYMAAVLWESLMIPGSCRHIGTEYRRIYLIFVKGFVSWTVFLLGQFYIVAYFLERLFRSTSWTTHFLWRFSVLDDSLSWTVPFLGRFSFMDAQRAFLC